jgi:hypothetical protein
MIRGCCVVILEVVFWWVDRCIGGIAAAAAAIDAGMIDFTKAEEEECLRMYAELMSPRS